MYDHVQFHHQIADIDRRRRSVLLVLHPDKTGHTQPETQTWAASYVRLINNAHSEAVQRIGWGKRRKGTDLKGQGFTEVGGSGDLEDLADFGSLRMQHLIFKQDKYRVPLGFQVLVHGKPAA